MFNPEYEAQMRLLLKCLPEVAKHDCFALKGGTAINLFVHDLPRVSIDIDLTYLPVRPRNESLRDISDTLMRIKNDVERHVPGSQVAIRRVSGHSCKLLITSGAAKTKIEPNLVLRGTISAPEQRDLAPTAQNYFSVSTSMRILAEADLYAGKLCATLDRQHPRDLFDVKLLTETTGITATIRRAFVVYLASHTRPIHELLCPNLRDITDDFERQFIGMARTPVALDELTRVQRDLARTLVSSLDVAERQFLLSLKSGDPDWAILGIEGLDRMPALRWKLMNIRKMDAGKRAEQLDALRDLLE